MGIISRIVVWDETPYARVILRDRISNNGPGGPQQVIERVKFTDNPATAVEVGSFFQLLERGGGFLVPLLFGLH
jgi:hypothetical protein